MGTWKKKWGRVLIQRHNQTHRIIKIGGGHLLRPLYGTWKGTQAVFAQDEDVTTTDSLKEACRVAGLSTALTNDLIGQIGSDRVKEELKRTTQEALDHGVRSST